jgi:hypothetical protein
LNSTVDPPSSLYLVLGALVANSRGLGMGETVVTEQVETVDGDRTIEFFLSPSLIE